MKLIKLSILGGALALLSFSSCKGGATNTKMLPATEFQTKVNETESPQLLDVRTPEEYATGHIAGATNNNIDAADFEQNLDYLDKNKPVFVYCKGGGRSASAAKKLKDMGFTEVYDLKGGMMAWSNENLPISQETSGNANLTSSASSAAGAAFTRADLDKLVKENPVVIVDYSAVWCGPCKKLAPVLEKLEKEFEGKVKVQKVDVDLSEALARELGIEGIPYVTKYVNGTKVKEMVGFSGEAEVRQLFLN